MKIERRTINIIREEEEEQPKTDFFFQN